MAELTHHTLSSGERALLARAVSAAISSGDIEEKAGSDLWTKLNTTDEIVLVSRLRTLTTEHLGNPAEGRPALDTLDRAADFRLATTKRVLTCTLRRDYEKRGDGIYWAMQRAGVLKTIYTEEERAQTKALNEMRPIESGEVVSIDGKLYRCRVLGDYSNAAVFDPIKD